MSKFHFIIFAKGFESLQSAWHWKYIMIFSFKGGGGVLTDSKTIPNMH